MRAFPTVLWGLLLVTSLAFAEIEKFAIPGDRGMSFHWWPKLAPVDGWQQDREHSLHYSVNALAPDGFTFANAPTVMYARALYKPRAPEVKSLEILIENDKRDFLANTPDIRIEEVDSLVTADGKRLRSFTFFPKEKGNWEQVSYGEEGEFYLMFTISSRSLSGYKEALGAYKQLIGREKENP